MTDKRRERVFAQRRAMPEITVLGTCPPPCGKVRYLSRREARRSARHLEGTGRTGLHPHPCWLEGSHWWHLSSADADARVYFRTLGDEE